MVRQKERLVRNQRHILRESVQGFNWLANGKVVAVGLKLAHLLVIRYIHPFPF
jgi:hypothetical protein